MEYITEIKAFYNLTVDNPLSTGQIALWHALMYINNKCHWTKNFTVSNATLQLYTGLSKRSVINAKNVLKQRGLIDFTNGNRGQSSSYEIKTLLNTAPNTAPNAAPNAAPNTAPLKRQKTKTKDKDNINPLIPFEGKLLESVNLWLAYKAERGQKYKPTGLQTLFKKIQDGVTEYGEAAVIRSIDNSIANNWQGLFFKPSEKSAESGNPFLDMLKDSGALEDGELF